MQKGEDGSCIRRQCSEVTLITSSTGSRVQTQKYTVHVEAPLRLTYVVRREAVVQETIQYTIEHLGST